VVGGDRGVNCGWNGVSDKAWGNTTDGALSCH
jgi:hypothetical protein